jgi:alpha-tubulin suppressor-like RCC1 family protein
MTRQRLIPTLVAITALLVMGLPAAASAKKAVKVTTGEEHVCALKPNGKVLCWGENDYGQADPPGGKFKAIDGGAYHTCGIKLNGRVKCWGYDSDYGETKAPSGKFKSISAGYEATCGIKANGKAKCWGYDGYGQVCPGRTARNSSRSPPVSNSPAAGSRTTSRCAGATTSTGRSTSEKSTAGSRAFSPVPSTPAA